MPSSATRTTGAAAARLMATFGGRGGDREI